MSELKRLIQALWEISTPKKKHDRREVAPEEILDWAKREMEEIHVRNRERAVLAITKKNNLQVFVEDLERQIKLLGYERDEAETSGEGEVAEKLLRRQQELEVDLSAKRKEHEVATLKAEELKRQIQREQEAIRQKTAEVLALKSRWKASAIALEIERELLGMTKLEQPGNPRFELETVRNLVGILLGVILVLLVVVGVLLATR